MDQKKVRKFLAQLEKNAMFVAPVVSIKAIKDHPADNKFLECSFTAKADFLITGNTRHFSFKTFHHTSIVTPAEFLYVIAKLLLKD